MIDEKDVKILNIIQIESKASNAAIGGQIGITPSAVFGRVRKLEEKGVIQGYETRLNPKALNLDVLAFVFIKMEIGLDHRQIDARLEAIPEIQEVHHIAGEDCYIIKIWAADTDDLGSLLLEKVHSIEGIKETRTTIVLRTVKQTSRLPLDRALEPQKESK